MEQNPRPESIRQLFSKVQQQLVLVLQSQNSPTAKQAMELAAKAMAKIEGLILADPCVADDDVRRVVEFTRGKIWVDAWRQVATT